MPKQELQRVGIYINANKLYYVVIREPVHEQATVQEGGYCIKDMLSALQALKKEIGNSPCHLALPYSDFIIKTLSFSSEIKPKEINQLLQLNAIQYFSHPLAMLAYDYEFCDPLKNRIRILASKKEKITNWRRFFDEAGLRLKTLSADVLALENCLLRVKNLSQQHVYAILLLHENKLYQMVMLNLAICFINVDPIGELKEKINYELETTKLIKHYESSKFFIKPVTHVICMTGHTKWHNKINLKVLDFSDILQGSGALNHRLAFGMGLSC